MKLLFRRSLGKSFRRTLHSKRKRFLLTVFPPNLSQDSYLLPPRHLDSTITPVQLSDEVNIDGQFMQDDDFIPLNEVYTRLEPWVCGACLGSLCRILSVEASLRFLKVNFGCPACGDRPVLFWDLANRDWVESVEDEYTDSIGNGIGSFDFKAGPFDVKRFGRHGLEEDIREVGTTSSNCPSLTDYQLRTCFRLLFEHTHHVLFLHQF